MSCQRCKSRPRYSSHPNCKWCEECRQELRHRPAGRLTEAQARQVRRLLFKMPREDIAREIGVSVPTLKRWVRDNGNIRLAYFNRWHANPKLVNQICKYYAKHGRAKTERRYPNVRVRSVIERYFKGLGFKPRQVRWTSDQLVAIAKMAGLVSIDRQAKYFDRPGANEGSIKSVWMKRFGLGGGSINGLSYWVAKHYVRPSCPYYETDFWAQRAGKKGRDKVRRIALWVDVQRHIKSETPVHLKEAISALAGFQRWLHGRNVRQSVQKILETV